MKTFKYIFLMSLLALVFSCGGDEKITNENNPEKQGQGGETPKVEEKTVELPSSSWTDKGYFDGTMYYQIISNNPMEATVSSCEKSAKSVLIPTWLKIDGKTYKVMDIANSAFNGCSGLISIDIPNSVTSIGIHAFLNCHGLTSITIPNSVTSIGGSAFSGCTGLTSIEIPNSVTSIGGSAFFGCTGLASVTIPDNVTSIGDYAFYGCTGLTSIKIANGVTSIGNSAFFGCTGLTSITIPNSVTSIGSRAFSYCYGLESIYIPPSVTDIAPASFYGCTGLKRVEITDIAAWCNIKFNSVTSNPLIHARNLYLKGEKIKNLIIPSNVTSISSYAFSFCDLTSVFISSNVKSIGKWVFPCEMESITVSDENQYYDSRENSNAIIESSSNKLIVGCKNTVVPNSVTSIKDDSFYGCDNLSSVTFRNTTPPHCDGYPFATVLLPNSYEISLSFVVLEFPISYKFDKPNLYVPTGSIDLYKSTSPWDKYNIVGI